MDKKIKLDGGTLEEQIKEMKEFFGLKPDQSFQDLDVDVDEDDDNISGDRRHGGGSRMR